MNKQAQIKEPTQEQIKELREWCGFKYEEIDLEDGGDLVTRLTDPDGAVSLTEPDIDLNNLFLYAVPKAKEGLGIMKVDFIDHTEDGLGWTCYLGIGALDETIIDYGNGDTPALALFWALYSVLKEDKDVRDKG